MKGQCGISILSSFFQTKILILLHTGHVNRAEAHCRLGQAGNIGRQFYKYAYISSECSWLEEQRWECNGRWGVWTLSRRLLSDPGYPYLHARRPRDLLATPDTVSTGTR